ncbi:universal stress protein [Salinirussus salinus]|jgi:nucleotide-binding universal stress UspA family protein|uniref:universal stress protein n=1 Tax=Salinirussus salinus TaxID=1198300 RepID=UPI00135C5DF0|nr:universal stress protein [Salinirussus salinus]
MYDDILVPTDGSSGTAEVLDHALAIAEEGTTVHGLYVVDKRHIMAADEGSKEEVRRSLQEEGERALDDVAVTVEDAGLTARTVCEEGIPHRTVVEYAQDSGIDLVVMGTHGRTGRQGVEALGSTTERVVENGSVPVLVVNI